MSVLLRSDEAKETASLFTFLAYMLNNKPDELLLEKLRENYKSDSSDSVEIEQFWQKYKDSESSEIVQDLSVEWARLFRGTVKKQKPPYAGIYISKDGLGTEIMLSLKYMYDSHGFIPAKQDRMDYLGTMLDFLAGLLESYALSTEKEQTDEANRCLATLKELCLKYITPWLERFVNQTLTNTDNPLYRDYMFTLLESVGNISDVLKQKM